jgi:hypothetical protein
MDILDVASVAGPGRVQERTAGLAAPVRGGPSGAPVDRDQRSGGHLGRAGFSFMVRRLTVQSVSNIMQVKSIHHAGAKVWNNQRHVGTVH